MGDFMAHPPTDFSGFAADVTAIAWHPRSEYLAVGLANGRIQLLRPDNNDPVAEWQAHDHPVIALTFRSLASRSSPSRGGRIEPDRVAFWDRAALGDWQESGSFLLNEFFLNARFSGGGKWLTTWTKKRVAVWNLAEKRLSVSYADSDLQFVDQVDQPNQNGAISNATVSPDGRLLAVGYDYTTADLNERGFVIWDLHEKQRLHRMPLNMGGQYPNGVTFSSDGRFFTFGCDEALFLYEVPKFRQLASWRQDSIHAVDISPDGQLLVADDIRGNIRMWTVSNRMEIAKVTHRIPRATLRRWLLFSDDQRYLAASTLDGIRVWHLTAATEKQLLAGHTEAIPTIDFHPAGTQFATGSKDDTVTVWNAITGQKVFSIPCDGDVQSVRFNGDGHLLAVAHWGGINRDVLVFDVKTRLVARAKHQLKDINRITFVGHQHLAASGHTGIVLWELPTVGANSAGQPAELQPLKSGEGLKCRDIAASPDGSVLAWTDKPADRDLIQFWNWQSGDPPILLAAPPMLQGWHGLAFSPSGKEILFVANTGRAEQWNLETQTLVSSWGSEGEFESPHIALSQDGRWFAGLRSRTPFPFGIGTPASSCSPFDRNGPPFGLWPGAPTRRGSCWA